MFIPKNPLEPFPDLTDPLVDDLAVIIVVAALGAVVDPNRRHSDRFCGRKVLHHIVDQQRASWIDREPLAQQLIAVRIGLGPITAGMDVVKIVEMSPTPIRSSTRRA